MTDTSPYTLRLHDGVPMAFPDKGHSLDDIRKIAQSYANGTWTPETRGTVELRYLGRVIGTFEPEDES